MEDETISLVWKRSAYGDLIDLRFPKRILDELSEKFPLSVYFSSKSSPTVIATIPDGEYKNISEYIEKQYPDQVELGYFC